MRTFDYLRASSPAQAVGQASGDGQRFYLAGGTTLLDLVKLDVMQAEHLVDINRLDLRKVEPLSDGRLRVGALVSNTELANHPLVRERYPVLAQAILQGASTALRNKATTAGNLMQRVRCNYFRDGLSPCNKREPGSGCAAVDGLNRSVHAVLGTSDQCIAAHPSDMCVAIAALGAQVTVQSAQGSRDIAFADFHLLPGSTPWKEHALQAHELITHLTLDAPLPGSRSAYLKLRDRTSYQFALASSAVVLVLDGERITDARIALGGVASKPWRASEAERALIGQPVSLALYGQVAQLAMKDARGYSHNAFKIPLGQQVITRNLRDLTAQELA
ncbi:xanthine dehydrogenase family protein subunit M [Pseudomonas sp. 21LCFQ02]|uniref:FAD binding domain-containing protein n=1 Tax=unclassified Pseudomonas TaxID=196821 RepID=UPI0004F6A472|nr:MULTISPECIES: xanthine dehydrogenase family protein subunit M [unclassified Pseudomonas]MCO8163796.1 xanthine dehydrogenase family protein subunit M [Pseudomonas sp. 21LCFQ010]MCO8170754.1 xanthine dehydrogenase family protein subunit M [Pseudomonas sp. 21LCFQ02]MCQ9422404.1 xanthine dehydrogenase family protein subunit M [Pseudomonas sp. LJDD11]BAP45729.1 oxidoreductase, molybdopterin-binding subunit [Pseudomonas sp. StFLB209]